MPTTRRSFQPSLAQLILWRLDRELWQLLNIHSVRQMIISDWLYRREQKRRRDRQERREYRKFQKRLSYLKQSDT